MATKHKHIFQSVSELLAACDKRWNQGRRAASFNKHFTGRELRSWDEIKKAVVAEWPEGLEIMQELIYEIDRSKTDLPVPTDIRRRKKWSEDSGDEMDVDRLRSGQDPWLAITHQQVRAPKQVTIVYNIGGLCDLSPSQLLWRGAAAICLADLLEKAGFRVEIWMAHSDRDALIGDSCVCFRAAKVKDMSEVVDIPTLVNAVSGWFFRTVMFQAKTLTGKDVCPGMGSTVAITEETDCVREIVGKTTAVVIDRIYTKEAAIKLIQDTVAKLSV